MSLCFLSFFIFIESILTSIGTDVLLSSGQVIFTSIVSPTDLALIFKNKYSISNVGRFSIVIPLVNIQALSIVKTASVICFISSVSNAIIRIFSSRTRNGLYLTFLPLEGKVNS